MTGQPQSKRVVFAIVAGTILAVAASAEPRQPAQNAPPPTGPESQAPPAAELYPAGETDFSILGPGVVEAGVQCDANGNIYFSSFPSIQVSYQLSMNGVRPPLTELSISSAKAVEFPVQSLPDYASSYGRGFYVGPRGDVYGLVVAYLHGPGFGGPNWEQNLVVKYNHDGTVDSVVKLEPPPGTHLSAFKLAVFLDGRFLVSGAVASGPPYTLTGPFTGIFDQGGGFVGPLTLPDDVRPTKADAASPTVKPGSIPGPGKPAGQSAGQAARKPADFWLADVQHGPVAGSLDGNIYLFRNTNPARLYVINSTGTVVRELLVHPPDPDLRPSQISPAGDNRLLVEFLYIPDRSNPKTGLVLGLVDLSTGNVIETYDARPQEGIPACSTPEGEFLFLASGREGKLEAREFVSR